MHVEVEVDRSQPISVAFEGDREGRPTAKAWGRGLLTNLSGIDFDLSENAVETIKRVGKRDGISWNMAGVSGLKGSLSNSLCWPLYSTPDDLHPNGLVDLTRSPWATLTYFLGGGGQPELLGLSLFGGDDHPYGLSGWLQCLKEFRTNKDTLLFLDVEFPGIRHEHSDHVGPDEEAFLRKTTPMVSSDAALRLVSHRS